MADRYWVGGSGTWDNTDTTHWSSTSGGSGGASTPTSADAVFFDTNSYSVAYSVTLGAVDISCGDITINKPASGNISIVDAGGNPKINFYGSFINNAGNTINSDFKRRKYFLGTGTHSFKFDGATPFASGDVYIQGTGTYNLTDASNFSVLNLNHSNGTLNTNGYTLSVYRYSGTGPSIINLSNSTTTHFAGGWTASNTVNAGTSTITITGAGAWNSTLTGYNIVSFNANGGSNTFRLSTVLNASEFRVGNSIYSDGAGCKVYLSANIICTTFNSVYKTSGAYNRAYLIGDTTSRRTLTATTISADNIDLTNMNFTNTVNNSTWGDAGNNNNVTFAAGQNVYVVNNGVSTSDFYDGNVFATSSGGTASSSIFPKAQDTIIFDDNSPATGFSMNPHHQIGSINASARTTAITVTRTNLLHIHGDFICNSNFDMFTSSTSNQGTAHLMFIGENDSNINANGGNIGAISICKRNSAATVKLLSDCLATTTQNLASFWAYNGIFDANGYNFTITKFRAISSIPSYTAIPTPVNPQIFMGEGNWTLTGVGVGTSATTGAIWYNSITATGLSLSPETSHLFLTNSSSGDSEIRDASNTTLAFNNVTKSAGTGKILFHPHTSQKTLINELKITSAVPILELDGHIELNYAELPSGISLTTTSGTFNWIWKGNRYLNASNMSVTNVNAYTLRNGVTTDLSTANAGFPAGPMFIGSTGTTTTATGWTAADAPVRYWVGGAGNWGETTHWSTTSGGTSGASIPDATTECIIDDNSGAGTISFGNTIYNPTTFFNLYGNNQSASITLSQSGNVTCGGDYVLDNSVNKNGNGNNYFTSARFGNRISTNNDQMYAMHLNGGGSYYLDSAVYASFQSSNCFNIYDVDFYSNGYSIQSSVQIDRQYNRTVDLTNSYIRCFIDWRITNTGTGTITLTGTQIMFGGYTSSNFYGGGLNYPFVENQNGSHVTLNYIDDNSYDRLDLPGCSNSGRGGTMTFTGTHTINDNGQVTFKSSSGNRRMLTKGGMTFGSNVTITAGDHDFQDFTATGATITGTRLGDVGGNTGVVFDAPKTVYYDGATGYNSATINLSNSFYKTSSGGATSSDNYPLPQDTLIFETPAGAGTHNLELPFYTTPMLDFSNVNTGDIQIYHSQQNYDYLYMKGVVLGPNARYRQKTTNDNIIVFVRPDIPKELSGDLEGTHLKLLTTEEFTFSTFAPENLYIQGNTTARHTNATGFAININNCQLTNFNGSPEAGNWYVGNSTVSGTSIGLIQQTEEDSKSGSPLMMF